MGSVKKCEMSVESVGKCGVGKKEGMGSVGEGKGGCEGCEKSVGVGVGK